MMGGSKDFGKVSMKTSLLTEQGLQQHFPGHIQVLSHVSENGTQRANPQRLVTRNGNVVLAALSRRQAHMATSLPRYFIAVALKQNSQFFATEVAWYSYTTTTSSRTACKRIRSGCSAGSK
jgi:hypothetical protein